MKNFGQHVEVFWIWGGGILGLLLFVLVISVAVEMMKAFIRNI